MSRMLNLCAHAGQCPEEKRCFENLSLSVRLLTDFCMEIVIRQNQEYITMYSWQKYWVRRVSWCCSGGVILKDSRGHTEIYQAIRYIHDVAILRRG